MLTDLLIKPTTIQTKPLSSWDFIASHSKETHGAGGGFTMGTLNRGLSGVENPQEMFALILHLAVCND